MLPKEIYLSDFYSAASGKLGIVQSFGKPPPAEALAAGIADDLAHSARWLLPAFQLLRPLFVRVLKLLLARTYVLVTTTEDLPRAENRLTLGEDFAAEGKSAVTIHYKLGEYDRQRIARMRKAMTKMLRPYRFVCLKMAENNRMFISIAAGTCRMGDEPTESVVDYWNRAHEIENLYIVDASFFPSNPAQNSGLTLAANALRVAQHLLQMKEQIADLSTKFRSRLSDELRN